MNVESLLTERRLAASLLILCGIVFFVAGYLFTARAIWRLPGAQSDLHLRWERGFVIAALLINVMGFVLLEGLLRAAGDTLIARLALAIYLVGAAVLLVAEGTFLHRGGWVTPQIVFHVVLAFLAQAAFGASLLRTRLVPGWAGWATLLWNIAWLVILPLVSPRDLYYPVLHHVAPLLIGIGLLVSSLK